MCIKCVIYFFEIVQKLYKNERSLIYFLLGFAFPFALILIWFTLADQGLYHTTWYGSSTAYFSSKQLLPFAFVMPCIMYILDFKFRCVASLSYESNVVVKVIKAHALLGNGVNSVEKGLVHILFTFEKSVWTTRWTTWSRKWIMW